VKDGVKLKPAKSRGCSSCLKGCFLCCGTIVGIIFFLAIALIIWLWYPYPDYPTSAFFHPSHTVVAELRGNGNTIPISEVLETFTRSSLEVRFEHLDEAEREEAIERELNGFYFTRAEAMLASGVCVNVFCTTDDGKEHPAVVAYMPSYGKTIQFLYSVGGSFASPFSGTNHFSETVRDAKFIVAKTKNSSQTLGAFGLFQGRLLCGELEPLRPIVDTLHGDTSAGASPYIAKVWPKDSTALFRLAVDNRSGTIGRMVQALVNAEIKRLKTAESRPATSSTTSFGTQLLSMEDLEHSSPIQDFSALTGLFLECRMPTLSTTEITLALHTAQPKDTDKLIAWVQQLSKALSETHDVEIGLGEPVREPDGVRFHIKAGTIIDLIEKHERSLKEQRRIEIELEQNER